MNLHLAITCQPSRKIEGGYFVKFRDMKTSHVVHEVHVSDTTPRHVINSVLLAIEEMNQRYQVADDFLYEGEWT
jgi:hypothetical protein